MAASDATVESFDEPVTTALDRASCLVRPGAAFQPAEIVDQRRAPGQVDLDVEAEPAVLVRLLGLEVRPEKPRRWNPQRAHADDVERQCAILDSSLEVELDQPEAFAHDSRAGFGRQQACLDVV